MILDGRAVASAVLCGWEEVVVRLPGAGDVFAGYRIVRRLGVGGMGTVYLAEHPRLPRRDAVKVLDPELGADPGYRARFEREAELAARLEHPNVVAVYDRGREGEFLWIAMRYVDGVDAGELVAAEPAGLPAERAVGIVAAAARGLDAAHRRGLLHRDVKPANILVSTDDDGADVVRLTDFGIARSLDAAATTSGSVLASFAYAAPETFAGGPLDARTDVYALGCTLYEMLTGAVPFARRSPAAAMQAHLYEPPPRPSATHPALAAFDPVIARALAKVPAHRYGSCGELARAATAALAASTPHRSAPHRMAPPPPSGTTGPAGGPGVTPADLSPAPHPTASAQPRTPSEPGIAGPAGPPRSARLLLIATTVAALVVAAAVAALLVRGNSTAGTPVATPSPATTTTPPATTTPPPTTTSAWGPAAYIVAAFPDLLPSEPTGTGYQGMRCARNDDEGSWLHCPATTDDGINVNIRCDPSRAPVTYRSDTLGLTDIHEESWTRPSGSGTIRWATDDTAGFGLLDVAFDDPDRHFCLVSASGGSGGQDVYDRWWRSAPL